MHIGILTLHLSIEQADSLKDKRQVVKSLLAHLRRKFNISAAEVEDLDIWRRAVVGVAVVSNEAKFADQVLNKVADHVESDPRVVLDGYGIEITHTKSEHVGIDYGDINVDDMFPDAA